MTKHLEEAAVNWICNHKNGEVLYVKDAFIAGAKWQKEQMMKGAVEVEVYQVSKTESRLWYPLNAEQYREGDKVHIIIVKEDEK